MLYQWLYSCFREDKRLSIRLNAAVLCHFLLGKLSQGKFSEIIHYERVQKGSNVSVYPGAAHT